MEKLFTKKGFLTVPLAIIIAGLIVGLSVIYAIGKNKVVPTVDDVTVEDEGEAASIDNLKPVTSADWILGDPNAPVKIVEFSDPECPFCKRFHVTMKQIVQEYKGKVAWVYRHFPLDSLHSQARKEANAMECAGELGGNVKFWAYLDRLMEITPSNDGLDLAELPKIAKYVGLDVSKFNACSDSDRYADKIEEQYQDATSSGGQGTPYSIVIGPKGGSLPINGAYPFSEVKKIVESAMKL